MTAGNSTPLTDGASVALLSTDEWAAEHNIPVLAYFVDSETAAVDYVNGTDGLLMAPTYAVPRLLAWYGDPEARYRYSGLEHQPLPWTPLLAEIRTRVQEACGRPFNAVLLNYYRDGNDSMGWHSDDEPELGRDPLIASLNLGGTRRFDLRRKGTTRIGHSLELGDGSLLVMGGQTQHHWQHQVAKTRKPVAPRINLTFRLIRGRA